jgi:hypothetical protein
MKTLITIEPGAQGNQLIAEEVMGWKLKEHATDGKRLYESGRIVWSRPWDSRDFNPTENIAHAWEVLDCLEAPSVRRQECDSMDDGEGGMAIPEMWICECENMKTGKRIEAEAKTAPLAICRAAWKAVLG